MTWTLFRRVARDCREGRAAKSSLPLTHALKPVSNLVGGGEEGSYDLKMGKTASAPHPHWDPLQSPLAGVTLEDCCASVGVNDLHPKAAGDVPHAAQKTELGRSTHLDSRRRPSSPPWRARRPPGNGTPRGRV